MCEILIGAIFWFIGATFKPKTKEDALGATITVIVGISLIAMGFDKLTLR